jgi:2-polyprenyl-6-methoxyphenol hydroxylase-like FAD-dependent oxidoreductase
MQLTGELAYEAVVFGAGPVGAAVALGLQQQGYSVVVFEKRSEQAVIIDAGKSINLSLSTRGNALLKELGVYDG